MNMKALLFDPRAGASGDMIMGCLLDLGADADAVRGAVESVGCRLEISSEERGHIAAIKATVNSERRYYSIKEAVSILEGSSLRGEALQKALATLDILATAEGQVHGVSKETARFHEIGALDALADIAGSCAALHSLGVDRILSLPISVGGGFARSDHGLLPVPGPAALEILKTHKMLWRGGPVEVELLTPTGAALLAAFVDEFQPAYPLLRAERVGYGAGLRELSLPNALRGLIADIAGSEMHELDHGDQVVQLETNMDDVTGEVLAYLIDCLLEAGALDVSVLPALMKKGRSGNVIRAIARQGEMEKLARMMMKETGSLGIRVFPSLHRFVARRETRTVEVEISGRTYRAAVKVSWMEGELLNIKPEYEDCRRIADETGIALRSVMQKVEGEGWRGVAP